MKHITIFESFASFEENQNLLEFLDKDSTIYESSLSRMWQYVEGDKSFGIISPFRKSDSKSENMKKYNELKKIVKDKKLGYIELEGGFKEEGEWVREKSMFIPGIEKKDLIDLGEKFDQYSVIYKAKDEFVEIGTNNYSGKGKVITDFIKNGWDKNLQIDSKFAKEEVFSRLIKGSHRDRKFLFNLKESYLLEIDPKNFSDSYSEAFKGKSESQRRYIRLL